MPKGVNATGKTFLERYVERDLLRDPEYVERKKNKRRALYEAEIIETEDGFVLNYDTEIRARKESREYDRRAFAAKLAALVEEWKPELIHAKMDVPLVARIETTFDDFGRAIMAVAEDNIDDVIDDLSVIYFEMESEFELLKASVLSHTGSEPEGDEDDTPVELWSMDLGRHLLKELGKEFTFLDIKPAPISITVPRALYRAFEEKGDLMTPAQIQHEASAIATDALKAVEALATRLRNYDDSLYEFARIKVDKGELYFHDRDDLLDWVDIELEAYVEEDVVPEIDAIAGVIASRVENLALLHAKRAADIDEHLRHRKRRIARKAVAPVIGITAGTLGILLGTGLIAVGPATAGLSAVAGAGIGLASVAAFRASLSGIKLLYEHTRGLNKLTKGMEKDIRALIKSYEKGMVPGKEISAAIINSVFVGTLVKSYPRIEERFELIEGRVAKVSRAQIDAAGQLDDLLKAIETDKGTLRGLKVDETVIDQLLKPFEDIVAELISQIIALGEKITIGEDGKSFNTIFASCKKAMATISGMIGSKTATATAIIPILTEFAFLIANASVGCAGVFEAGSALAAGVNGGVVILGEVGDGIGALDATG